MVDRISSLPDGIICHILSFLPTHDSVSTTVLSKRWYPLWRYVTVLHFDDESVDDDEQDDKAYLRFKEFLLSVLLFRDPTQPIKSFTIKHYQSDYTNLNKWVSFVMQRGGVEYLDLDMATDWVFIVVLKLSQFYVKVNDVSSVELPLLKVLHLRNVEFTEYRLLPELLSGCPNVEDFEAIDVRYSHHIISNVHFQILTKLMRAMILDGDFTFPLEAFYNVEYLHLDIRDEVSPHYDHMPVFCNLTKLKLFLYNSRWQWLLELLKHCPKLQILIIHEAFMSRPDVNWDCLVPQCVSLHLRECTIYRYGGMEGELRFARYILQNARVLKTLTIHSTGSSDNKKLQMLQELSLCLRSSATCKLVFI